MEVTSASDRFLLLQKRAESLQRLLRHIRAVDLDGTETHGVWWTGLQVLVTPPTRHNTH